MCRPQRSLHAVGAFFLFFFFFLALRAALTGPACAQSERLLTGSERTPHFELRWRPGSRAAAGVERIAVQAERDLARICDLLAVPVEGGFTLYLYDDVVELAAITRTQGNAGYSSGKDSHLPFDNDQTRFHEMVHLVAARLAKTGDEPRNLFFAEGLANALLEFVDGVPVHAVAAFEKKRGELPGLAEMAGTKDFYAWLRAHPGLDTYDIAGSFFRHLIDAHGIEKVKRWYAGTSAPEAFGSTLADLEQAWHQQLDGYRLRPEVEVLLRRKRGETVRFSVFETDPDKRLPAEVLGKAEEWVTLAAAPLVPDEGKEGASWKRDGGAVRGQSAVGADWCICRLGEARHGDCAVRARIQPAAGIVGVQLRLGRGCQAMVTNAGAFLWKEGVVAAEPAEPIAGRAALDLLLVRRGDLAQVWLDGVKVLEGRVASDPAAVGLGVAGGSAVFEQVRVRGLK